MMANAEDNDLPSRLSLIENMIAEGRRSTESWGWTFVLWGVAYYVAIGWQMLGHSTLAWPVTMVGAMVVMGVLIGRMKRSEAETTISRAIGAVWIAMGVSMFLLLLGIGVSGRFGEQLFVAVIGTLLGMANAISGLVLKWKMQFACAVVWWAAGLAACFATAMQSIVFLLVAVFFCQIVFGIYGMIAEARERRRGVSHA